MRIGVTLELAMVQEQPHPLTFDNSRLANVVLRWSFSV